MRNYLCITCLLQSVTVYFSKHSLVKVTPSTQLAMLLLERTQSLTLIRRPTTDMFTLHDVTTRWQHTQSAGQISLHLEHVLFKVHTLKNNYYLHTILFFNLLEEKADEPQVIFCAILCKMRFFFFLVS